MVGIVDLDYRNRLNRYLSGLAYPATKEQVLTHIRASNWTTSERVMEKSVEYIDKRLSDRHDYNSADQIIKEVTKYG